ncbi:hypothetical protein HAX54_051573 [Datura stramonium]|uniref:V-type proton ATPase subunit D n=1 Tax=Datura stramonium TaxID=4076 RepID=A0ABS8SXV6_DATST|nr:hypothetical protein [Datura stramonium]
MSGQIQCLNVVPTVTMLGVIKARLVGATRGHAFLEKKSDGLTMQFHQILKKIVSTKELMGEENIAGMKLHKFEHFSEGGTKNNLTGLARGGQQVQACRAAYVKSIELLVELASLQTSFLTLDEAIKTTNRRVNALENVVKPWLENTVTYIKGELDELEEGRLFSSEENTTVTKRREVQKKMAVAKLYAEEKAAKEFVEERYYTWFSP